MKARPGYEGTRSFRDLTLPPDASELLGELGDEGLLFDPPYDHQARALELALTPPFRDLVVTTGTGSGKTETFLLPVLGRLATEAATCESFATRAVRALLLYPMNALVNDQLGRLRLLFGDNSVAHWFETRGGRPMKFARYTGRTLYPGRRRDNTDRHRERLQSLRFYLNLENRAAGDGEARTLIAELKKLGKWPRKAPQFTRAGGRPVLLVRHGQVEATETGGYAPSSARRIPNCSFVTRCRTECPISW